MNRNTHPYSEPAAEHKFENAHDEIRSFVVRTIDEYKKEDAANIITGKLLRAISEEEEEIKKRNANAENELLNRKKSWKSRVIIAGAFVGLVFLCTYIMGLIGSGGGLISILGVITAIISILAEYFLSNSEMEHVRGSGESVSEGIINSFKRAAKVFRSHSNLHLLIFVGAVLFVSGLFAQWSILPRIAKFFEAGYIAFANYGQDDCEDKAGDGGTDVQVAEEKQEIPTTLKEVLAESDERLIQQLNAAEVTPKEKSAELKLSVTDYNTVFFQGELMIGGFEMQEEIDEKIFRWVEEQVEHGLENVFNKEEEDGGAPQKVKNRIAEASDAEEELHSFAEVNDRLDFRECTNNEYPKRDLTQLIANDYHKLALLLVWNNGEKDTILYYYGQCIKNLFKCLEYKENTDKTIKQTLTSIAQKFRDIVYVWPDFEGKEIASKLEKAFRYAADQY